MNESTNPASTGYDAWVEGVSDAIKREPVWKFYAYRKALYLYDLAWSDCDELGSDYRGRRVAAQLIESVGSISANVEEGHGRGPRGRERDQFLRYAMGSSRESPLTRGHNQSTLRTAGRNHLIACDRVASESEVGRPLFVHSLIRPFANLSRCERVWNSIRSSPTSIPSTTTPAS